MQDSMHWRLVKEGLTLEEFLELGKQVMAFANNPATQCPAMFVAEPNEDNDLCKAVLLTQLRIDDTRLATLEAMMNTNAVPMDNKGLQ